MITLTTPYQILNTFAGALVAYNKVRVTSIDFDLVAQGITALFQIVVSTDPTKPIIVGTISVSTTGLSGQISVPQLGVNQTFPLTPAQAAAIQTIMANFQNSLEAALVNQGVMAGTQAAGQ